MESQRSLLLIALLVVSFLLYQQWQIDHAPVAPIKQSLSTSSQVPPSDVADYIPASGDAPIAPVVENKIAKTIKVVTDVLEFNINTQGGDVVKAKLLQHKTELKSKTPYTILDTEEFMYIAQSGLIGEQGPDANKAGRPIYHVEQSAYNLADDANELTIDLTFTNDDNIRFVKRFRVYRGQYKIDVEYIIENNSSSVANVQLYTQLKQSTAHDTSSGMVMTYRGAAYSTTEDPYEKYSFDDIADKKLKETTQGGWVAMLEHYFVSAWVPQANEQNTLYTEFYNGKDAVIGVKSPVSSIETGTIGSKKTTLYVGPKDQEALEKIATGLDLTIDYGILFFISQPLYWLLNIIQSGQFELFDIKFDFGGVGNWGIAIIIITLFVKGGMYPLTKAQYVSMAKMRKLQPKMTALKERFGTDKQKMSQAMMELYRKEKVNPAGGCLPILFQMPIFLALYWVFVESVELRHAPFALWIIDLSAKDPYFVLPLLMGISMFVLQKMQPMTIQDPMQQKIMTYMPVMFSVFMAWFPSGLVLYWFISNVISILQMKIIFAGIEKAEAKI